MSRRPIRDIPPSVNYSGDAARVYGRIDKNIDAIARGGAAITRGLDMLAQVAAERAAALSRIEDELTGARAETELRRRFGEGVRALDPNEPDYADRVQALFSSTAEAVAQEFQFRSDEARRRFGVRVENARTQAVLQSLEVRERAALERAEIEINKRLNAAAAAIVMTPNSYGVVSQAFEAEIAPLVAGFNANQRDRVLQGARERMALEYVRTLTNNRDFRGAEAALRTLGQQQVLSAQAIGALRSALVSERRQAEAEARAARANAYNEAMMAIQEARAIAEQGGSVRERDAALEQAARAAEQVGRIFGPDSLQARRASLALRAAAYSARDTGAEALEAARIAMINGDALSPEQQSRFIMLAQRSASDAAERALLRQNPEATADDIASARLDAAISARESAVGDLVRWQPGERAVPAVSAEIRNALAMGPNRAAQSISRMYAMFRDAPAFQAALREHPEVWAAVNSVAQSGQPVTQQTLEAALMTVTRMSPEQREARKQDFDDKFAKPRVPGSNSKLPGVEKAMTALREVARDRTFTDADARAVMATARELAAGGRPHDEAFAVAAKMFASQSIPTVAARGNGIVSGSFHLPPRSSPAALIPGEVANLYGVENALKALAERGARRLQEIAKTLPETERPDLRGVTVVPVRRDDGIAYMLISERGGRTVSTMMTDANGQLIVEDAIRPGFWDEDVGLRARLEQAQRRRGRPEETQDDQQPIDWVWGP